MSSNFCISFILLLICYSNCFAVSIDSNYVKGANQQTEYMQHPVSQNSFNKEEWKNLKQKLKINEKQPKKKKEDKKESKKKDKNIDIPTAWVPIIKWILFTLIIGGLLVLVLRVLGINPFTKKSKKEQFTFLVDELEDNLDKASIDPHLYAAIKDKDYKLAIRLYYLMIIQQLALKEKIKWKKYKTNKHYLNEMRPKEDYSTFKYVTFQYEKYWFGTNLLTEKAFNDISTEFANYLHNIK